MADVISLYRAKIVLSKAYPSFACISQFTEPPKLVVLIK